MSKRSLTVLSTRGLPLLAAVALAGFAAPSPAAAQNVVAVKMVLNTSPGTAIVRNIDVAGGLDFTKVKRYSVTLSGFPTVPSGVDRVSVRVGVLDPAASSAVDVINFDRDGAGLARGAVLAPYVGTNSFIRISRGADGLGNFAVRVNAYVEIEP